MAKGRRLARSISLNVPPSTFNETQRNTILNQHLGKPKTLKSKVAKFLNTKLFVNQIHSESTQRFTSSTFQLFIVYLRAIGLSYRIHQKEAPSLMIFMFVYNCFIFCCQILYGFLLLFGFYQSTSLHTQWTSVTYYCCLTIWLISIWMNIKLHSIKPRFIDEAFSSASVNERHVDKREFLLKLISICSLIIIFITIISIEIARCTTNDRFGIYSKKAMRMPALFTCGTVCVVFEAMLHAICLLVLLSSAAMYALLTIAIATEASNLIADIKRYSSSQNLDHLIYRYQSVEKSVRVLEQYFSTALLGFIIITVAAIFTCLSKKAKIMISDSETGGINVFCTMLVFMLSSSVTISSGIYVNNQLDDFRSASHKLSDLQQDSFCISSIKLLSFMLRLSYDADRVKVGKVFAITPQAIIILILFSSLVGICLFAVDEGCLNIF